jgi:DNA-binding transcriptional LysR family regulator
MGPAMLEWDDLRHFLAITRHRTLSGAARALGVQQSTMGRRLDALEERIGARLLQKTPAGFVLTAAGEAILGNVERIENEALTIERAITGQDVRLEGVVRLTTVESLAVEILPPIVAAFHDKYPGIVLDMITDSRSLSLAQREADVALRLVAFTQHDLAIRKVADFASGVYASRAYLDQHGVPDFARGAPDHRTLLRSDDGMSVAEMVWFAGMTAKASVALRSNGYYMLAAAAESGMGIACLPRFLGDAGRLVRLETPTAPPAREVWMGVHNDIRHTPRIRAITDFLAAGLRQQASVLAPR